MRGICSWEIILGSVILIALALGSGGPAYARELEARIVDLGREGTAIIDTGSPRGVRVGQEGAIFYVEMTASGKRRVTVGRARVIAVRVDSAEIRILESREPIRAGYRVIFGEPVATQLTPTLPAREVPGAPGPVVTSPLPGRADPTAAPSSTTPIPAVPLPPSVACVGRVSVVTNPAGAIMSLDGVHVDNRTPTVLQGVPCGLRRITVALDDHEDTVREVAVQAGQVEEVSVGLRPRRGRLRVTSVPHGATVIVDGVKQGPTPLVLEGIAWGSHHVRLEALGFLSAEQTVRVAQPGTVEHSVVMVPCRGRVSVATDPPGGHVVLDNTRSLGPAPVQIDDLECGTHRLVVDLVGREEVREEVVVEHNQSLDVRVVLRPRRSRVLISVAPGDAEIRFRDQRYAGSPVVIEEVPWGEYPVEIQRDGFRPLKQVLAVDRPGPIEYSLTLERVPPPQVPLLVSTFGYTAAGGIPMVLTLGILGSEYAIEIDGSIVVDWRIRGVDANLSMAPGNHRLRVLVRTFIGRDPQVFHEAQVLLALGVNNEIRINFLTHSVAVNGQTEPFNGPAMRSYR